MKRTFLRAAVLVSACLSTVRAQAPKPKQFFEGLTTRSAGVAPPSYEQLLQVTDQFHTLSQAEVVDALPAVFQALQKSDEPSAIDAAFALSVIARRPDSAVVLRPWIKEIGSLLSRTDARLNAAAILVFMRMTPPPGTEAVPLLTRFLFTDQGSMEAKPDAVSALMKLAPNAPEPMQAVARFMRLPLEGQTRMAAINAVGIPKLANTAIIDIVVEALGDPSKQVKLAAIQTLDRIGGPGLARARTMLLKLAADETAPPEVRKTAQSALERAER